LSTPNGGHSPTDNNKVDLHIFADEKSKAVYVYERKIKDAESLIYNIKGLNQALLPNNKIDCIQGDAGITGSERIQRTTPVFCLCFTMR